MKRNKLMIAATAGLVGLSTLGGTVAVAQSNGDSKDTAEVQAFLKSSTSILQAIQAAESESGGTAVSAEFDDSKSGSFYEVDTVKGDQLMSVRVDAASGTVTASKDEGMLSQKSGEDDDHVSPAQLSMKLVDVVKQAETQSGGKVMTVGYEAQDGKVQGIEIELASADGKTQVLALDPANGTLTAVADNNDNDSGTDNENENDGADNDNDSGDQEEDGEGNNEG